MTRPIYLDYGATTPLDPRVAAAMGPWGVAGYGNPHSAHLWGYEAKAAVETARGHVAALLGAPPETVTFTSGATESVNWALKGVLTAPGQSRRRIVTLATEHSCVLETARYLESLGAHLTVVPVRGDGIVDLGDIERALGEDVALVSAMLVNNEIGVVQPIAEIAALAHHVGAVMHCDAAQAFGKVDCLVDHLSVELLSLTAHKIYGPKGIGALYRRPFTVLTPLLHGGGQEDGRSGTMPTALCVGLGEAARIAAQQMAADRAHAEALRDRLIAALTVPYRVNGALSPRWPGNLSLSFPGTGDVPLLPLVPGLALSSGSACAAVTGSPQPCADRARAERRRSPRRHPHRLWTLHHRRRYRCRRRADQCRRRRPAPPRGMTRIRFISADGARESVVEATEGSRLLDVAQADGQPLEGTCEGAMACSTCHVLITGPDAARPAAAVGGGGGHARFRRRRGAGVAACLPDSTDGGLGRADRPDAARFGRHVAALRLAPPRMA